ncbi:MAG: hypothetical protein HY864_05885 [Chloroflexi bacterium]|nr:hypothetical protein [Chloroflexota bacterium]
MFSWQRKNLILAVYGLLVSIGAFIAAVFIFLIPSDPGNNFFLGFSVQRLALIGGIISAGLAAVAFSIKVYQNQIYAERIWHSLFERESIAGAIRWGAAVIFIAGWIASFTPPYRFGDFKEYFIRISPIINWLTFASLLTLAISSIEKYGFNWQQLVHVLRAQRKTLVIALISMAVFTLTWVMIAVTGMGVRVSEDYWYGAGVPILGLQVLLALVIGLGVLYLERSSPTLLLRSDLFIFIFIWGLAAFLWVREPLQPSYFSPLSHLPNLEYYPYSDAITFDIGSQFALIGQGINNGLFFDRALYMGFLVFLHSLAGQDYAQVVALQAGIYAVFPAILFLLGKAIHGRSFGLMLAILAALRGINSLAASNMIDLANQKQMLTDFPTAIFIAWFALMAVKWVKSPGKNFPYALWVGGITGLAVMLRTHALFLGLFAIVLAAVVYWRQKLRGLIVSVLLVITLFASILPWGLHNSGSVFDVYMVRIRTVLEARYPVPLPAASPVPAPTGIVTLSQETATPIPVSAVPTPADANIPEPVVNSESGIQPSTISSSLATHFLHNIVTSILILPATPFIHDLDHTLNKVTPFWEQYWDGRMSFGIALFVFLNLFIIALGMGASWRSAKLAGLIPLGVFLTYNLANALARTSGGRYIVPVDWAVVFYFALGLLQIILWGTTLLNFGVEIAAQNGNDRSAWTWEPIKAAPWILLLFLFAGGLLPMSELFFPRMYPLQTQADLLATLDEKGYMQEMGFDRSTLQAASDQWPSLKIINGRALYPRYLFENKGEAKNAYPYLTLGYPRIALTVIGPLGTTHVILPQDGAPDFSNASDVIVLGCLNGQNMDALVVVLIQESAMVYSREPSAPLQCPLPQPVCDENHICR